MPVIALTGATGFVGRCIVQRLTDELPESDLALLVRDPGGRRLPSPLATHRTVPGSLSDERALAELVAGADAVIHCAAAIGGNRASDFDRANIVGTRRLVDAVARRAPDAHFIHVSSLAARAPGLSAYAASKRAAEEIVQARLRRHSVVRPPAVYGPQDPALADFWRLLARGWLVRLGPRHARFSLLHVEDLARAVAALVRVGPAGRILTAAGPEPENGWTWAALSDIAAECRGAPVRTLPVPATLLRTSAAASLAWGRAVGRTSVLNPGKARELLHPDWVCDNLELERALGWRPTTSLARVLATLPGWTTQ